MAENIKKVLIVDDDESDCFIAKHVFKKFSKDIEIVFAHNGKEALDICETALDLDAIILDINMPFMTGHEFLEAYCKRFPERKIPVFMMLTSSENEEDKIKAKSFEVVKDFITKPLTIDQVKGLYEIYKKNQEI